MQIMIEIPDEMYQEIKETFKVISGSRRSERFDYILFNAVNTGTPLPKGHGRLIDADYLREDFKASKRISFAERMDISCIVDHAPTIIEADRGGNNADNN